VSDQHSQSWRKTVDYICEVYTPCELASILGIKDAIKSQIYRKEERDISFKLSTKEFADIFNEKIANAGPILPHNPAIEDKYNNVYNFHKIWQECLRPGSDLCFMDIPSFSISAAYITTDNHLTEGELRNLYEKPTTSNIEDYVKNFSTTMYPLLFPIRISRGTANATSESNAKISVTYVRTPILLKNKTLQTISYDGQSLFK
jgi:hypothetical protein